MDIDFKITKVHMCFRTCGSSSFIFSTPKKCGSKTI
jgi:hypothetical protein